MSTTVIIVDRRLIWILLAFGIVGGEVTLPVRSGETIRPVDSTVRLSAPVASVDESLLDRYLAVDRWLGFEAGQPAAEFRATKCAESDSLFCVVREFRKSGIEPVVANSSLLENTVTSVLTSGRGSCAALVATLLTARDSPSSFRAVVLREHVLVTSGEPPGLIFDLLDPDLVLTHEELAAFGPLPPSGPVSVDSEGFLPYYVDNLAARLAESGDAALADAAFQYAIQIGPGIGRLRYNYGMFLNAAQRFAEAVDQIRTAMKLGWIEAQTWSSYGTALLGAGNVTEARAAARESLELDPKNETAQQLIGKLER